MGVCCSQPMSTQSFQQGIRVIHINGCVEDLEPPVRVDQITGKPPTKHVLCSSVHLLSYGSQPLPRPEEILLPGRLYFLLPRSIFHSDSITQTDLALLSTRLTAVARAVKGTVPPLSLSRRRAEDGGEPWAPELSTIQEWWSREQRSADCSERLQQH